MSEVEELRAELAEVRQGQAEMLRAILEVAHTQNQFRYHLFNIPRGKTLRPDQTYANLVWVCSDLEAIARHTPNIQGTDWMQALEKRSGIQFEEFYKQFRKRAELEEEQRAARRKAAA